MTKEHIIKTMLSSALDAIIVHETNTMLITKQEKLPLVMQAIKLSSLLKYNTLLDIYSTDDIAEGHNRFKLHYMLLSLTLSHRLIIKTNIAFKNNIARANSITKYFASANFLEREVWDLFGIYFAEHNDLRRLLTDYGFKGFPLRKDFPVTGFRELKYNDNQDELEYVPVKFAQAYRLFSYENPWSVTRIS